MASASPPSCLKLFSNIVKTERIAGCRLSSTTNSRLKPKATATDTSKLPNKLEEIRDRYCDRLTRIDLGVFLTEIRSGFRGNGIWKILTV